jgi:hypothetical protein
MCGNSLLSLSSESLVFSYRSFIELPTPDLNPCDFLQQGHLSIHCSAIALAKLMAFLNTTFSTNPCKTEGISQYNVQL